MLSIRSLTALLFGLALSTGAGAQPTATDRNIAQLQASASRSNTSAGYDQLGSAYLQKGRETSDFSYYARAEAAFTKSLELTSAVDMSAAAPLTHLAAVRMAEHRFSEAADYAERALVLGSGDMSPFGLLGDAHADMGDYDQAAQDYDKLLLRLSSQEPSRGLVYMHDSRVSYLKFIHGDVTGAVELAEKAVVEAIEMHVPAENLAWSYFQLGEYRFQSGDISGAELAYRQSLDASPGYYRGLSALAKVRVAQQKYAEAIDLYQKAIEEIPIPEYVAALGDIYTKLGQPSEAKKQYDLVEYIGYLTNLNQHAYNRELALFYADRNIKLQESLELAKRELEVRRDIYSKDVLAWSLYKNGKTKEAASMMDEVLRLGTRDPMLFFHAGLIRRDLGDIEAACQYLRRALAINPQFHIFYADTARTTLDKLEAKPASKWDGTRQ